MYQVQFSPRGQRIATPGNETLSQVAARGEVIIPHACGKTGRCSTCRVQILAGHSSCSPRTEKERAIAHKMRFSPDVRLACQTVVNGDVVVKQLVQDDEDVHFSSLYIKNSPPDMFGVEKHMFILFADIRGFTAFAEKFLPYDIIYVLNRYFHAMGEVIKRHGGHIDNYMGDALLALFEADDPREGAKRAVHAALEMLDTVKKVIQPHLNNFLGKNFSIGIGLHYGLVVAGAIGAFADKRATVIGDAVNFASRVETANKEAGTEFLISEETYDLVRNKIAVNRSIHVSIKGKTGKHSLFEVIGLLEEARAKKGRFWAPQNDLLPELHL